MATHDKGELGQKKEKNYNNQRAINTIQDKRKVENKERLGLCSVRDLGPRGSKDKLFKLEKDRPNRGCERDCEECR